MYKIYGIRGYMLNQELLQVPLGINNNILVTFHYDNLIVRPFGCSRNIKSLNQSFLRIVV